MTLEYKYKIEETPDVLKDMGITHNVQEYVSVDNNDYYYCGNGRFCQSLEEAETWIANRKAGRN